MRIDEPRPDATVDRYRQARIAHWDRVARDGGDRPGWSGAYHARLIEIYRLLVPPGRRVLELGCGDGDLLAALAPSVGVGVDFSGAMLDRASRRHPGLSFVQADAHDLPLRGPFDVIVLSDLVDDLWDVQRVLEGLAPQCTPRTRVILNSYSRLWEWPLTAARRLGLARPLLDQNWLTVGDISHLLDLAGFERIRSWREILWPFNTPGVAALLNRAVVKLWPLAHLGLTNVVVARPKPGAEGRARQPTVSVVVPARNEAGNILGLFERVPEMGAGTELIFVEGHSTDDTYQAIASAMQAHPGRRAALFRQTGRGKGDAVRLGFEHATGQVLMILDADLTVAPEDLPRFYAALHSGTGEFINGVRLVYPMEGQAMRLLNLAGNKFFGLAFSWMLGQPIKDTLCGTKVLWADDYRLIAANRSYFGDFDPFGDFDLLFGGARLGLKIVDMPIRYRKRMYGQTNIRRFTHGALLLRMLAYAAARLKFV